MEVEYPCLYQCGLVLEEPFFLVGLMEQAGDVESADQKKNADWSEGHGEKAVHLMRPFHPFRMMMMIHHHILMSHHTTMTRH